LDDIGPHLRECGFSEDVTQLVPSEHEHGRRVSLSSDLIECHNVSMLLQMEGDERLDLFQTRVRFDAMFPNMRRHLSADATIIHNVDFERAVVKLQGRCEKDLNSREKLQIRRFETTENDDEEVVAGEGEPRNRARMLLDEHPRKQSDNYRSTKHILPTTNIVERLFSRAKLALTDHRKRMTPRHPELLLIFCGPIGLCGTLKLWNCYCRE
jgi:hypothetical protein